MFPGLQYLPEGQIVAFGLIFLRIFAFLIAWPVFGVNSVPMPMKILFAIILSMLFFPQAHLENFDLIKFSDQLYLICIREIFVGLFLGFLLRMFFYSVNIAGEIIGLSTGLSSAQIFNPSLGSQTNVLENFQLLIATLFLLAMNGHHMFIQGLASSFDLVPVTSITLNSQVFSSVSLMMSEIFVMGFKMAAPIVVSLLLANLALGVLGRTIPQLNVFVLSMQLTIILGIFIMILTLPFLLEQLELDLTQVSQRLFQVMKVI